MSTYCNFMVAMPAGIGQQDRLISNNQIIGQFGCQVDEIVLKTISKIRNRGSI